MENNKLEKHYGLVTAICLVVGIVIGSGVFFKAEKILTANRRRSFYGHIGLVHWRADHAYMFLYVLPYGFKIRKSQRYNRLR